MIRTKFIYAVSLTFFFILLLSATTAQEPGSGEWPNYGRDPGGMRHSPLTQINRENVGQLTVAWTYQTGELDYYGGTSAAEKAAFEATPIMVEGRLYLSTPSNRVIALDAVDGKELWVNDPKVNLTRDYSEITSRGVSTWLDRTKEPGEPDRRRIFVATIDGRLIALNAATGTPIPTFGVDGAVDLKRGVGDVSATSPPAVIGDLLVIGSSMGDNYRLDYPPGVVRAFDARTGTLRWSWDPIPRSPESPAWPTWKGTKAGQTGAANAWTVISADEERNLVFVPTTCPSPDYYGGERIGQNLYANSIVALHAETGALAWYFQTVHHDIWDYDNPAQPALITVEREGRQVPAVAVGTKMGHIFLLNRDTGEPLFPVEERQVPQSDVEGERTWPTQPFPALLPQLGLHHVSPDDAWGLTPEDRELARKRIAALRYEGIFTPPSLKGSIIAPSNVGGINWGGLSIDPRRGLLVTNVNRLAAVITLVPRKDVAGAERASRELPFAEVSPQKGTPYALKREYLIKADERGMQMQTPPPWGTLAAVNINTGELEWEVPLGFMLDLTAAPEAENWGSLSLGGPLTTAGGLVFVAATIDGHFRAFDIETGELLWKVLLPAGGQATPMSYQVEEAGKQYVVICAGGHGKMKTKLGDYVVAYALP